MAAAARRINAYLFPWFGVSCLAAAFHNRSGAIAAKNMGKFQRIGSEAPSRPNINIV
jgi:hypothetical protein